MLDISQKVPSHVEHFHSYSMSSIQMLAHHLRRKIPLTDHYPFGTMNMADTAKNVKSGIDKVAEAAKDATDKATTAAAKVAKSAGEAVKSVGQKIKDSGK